MAKILSIANKMLSLRGRMEVTNEDGSPAYDAVGEIALFSPTWRIKKNEKELASVQRKLFSWRPTWVIKCGSDSFQLKRKLLSWTRQYSVVGGSYNGAIIKGDIWDLSFRIFRDSENIASAAGKIFTLRDRHDIEIYGDAELLVVISMVVLHLDKNDSRDESDN